MSEHIPEVNHGKSDKVSPEEVQVFTVKTNEEMTKLIYRGKGALRDEAVFVDLGVE
jgi:hypothetical protein